jgi:hypothetical protein
MTRVGAYVACALAFLATTGMASARSGESGVAVKCPRVTRHIVAANAQAEIFEASSDVFGCAYGRTKAYRLGSRPECGAPVCFGVKHELLAGAVVAYESYFTSEGVGRWYVVVRGLRNGRMLRNVPTGIPLKHQPENAGVGPIVGLVVKPNGSVAWIAEDFERSTPTTSTSEEARYYDVYASDKAGTRLLASGLDVSPSSLALAGSTLYWTQGGKPESSVLN